MCIKYRKYYNIINNVRVLKLAFITDAANSLSMKCFNAYRTPLAQSVKLQFSNILHIMTAKKKTHKAPTKCY